MFKNQKKKKRYPAGTFISTPARIVAILQLCIAFSIICWNMSIPFMGQAFNSKKELLLYESVKEQLDPRLHQTIITKYESSPPQKEQGFIYKSGQSIGTLLFRIPPFEMAWLILAVIVPVMLLKKSPHAQHAIWFLPLIACIYGIDNFYYGVTPTPTAEEQLYPTENTLVNNYMDAPLSSDILTQHTQLKEAWNRYLINEWGDEQAFNVARLEAIQVDNAASKGHRPQFPKDPVPLLLIYISWNFLFAGVANRQISTINHTLHSKFIQP